MAEHADLCQASQHLWWAVKGSAAAARPRFRRALSCEPNPAICLFIKRLDWFDVRVASSKGSVGKILFLEWCWIPVFLS